MRDEPTIGLAASKPNGTAARETPTLRRSRGQKTTRERILASAERLFAERGFERVSMPAIARASGVTAGAIYKHFESKADLLFEVVRSALSSVRLFSAPGSEVDLLLRQVAIYTERETRPLRQLSLEIHSASRKHPRVRSILRRALEMNIQQLRRAIEPAQRVGKIDPDLDADFLANAVIVFMMGLAHMETIAPQLVGNPGFYRFIENRVIALLGIRDRNAAAE
jgi:TetR/AcrR family transcriptional regulator, transcriptional repressor of aconitase